MAQEDTLKSILETVEFIKENAATKDDLNAVRVDVAEMKKHAVTEEKLDEKLTAVKSEIMSSVDGFVKLHTKLDTELTALRSKCDRLEKQLQFLAGHLKVDLDMAR